MTRFALSCIVALCALTACERDFRPPKVSSPGNTTAYDTAPDTTTPAGVRVRTNGKRVDLAEIDTKIRELVACAGLGLDPSSFVVVFAPDAEKYLDFTEGFDCWTPSLNRCSGAVQKPNAIIVTPDLSALKHELLHFSYGVKYEHDPLMRKCEDW